MERSRGAAWAGGILLGAAAMYFLDPRSGSRRRGRVRDRLNHALSLTGDSVDRLNRDFTNRTHGAMARARRLIASEEPVDDRRLAARARATLGRLTSHPGAIRVAAEEGTVTLSGMILEREVGDVLTGIRRVRGVRRVVSRLESVADARRVPSLQGGKEPPGLLPDLFQHRMSPSSRALVGAAGALLGAAAMRRGPLAGSILGGAAALLLARAAANVEAGELVGAGEYPVTVQKSLVVEAPVPVVFRFWSSFRNFPRFMRHLREVRESESGISHWVAEGPLGIPVSWDAEITALQPHHRLAWRSLEGSRIRNEGEVLFSEAGESGTRVDVRMTYHPPGGALGQAVATLFGANPQSQLNDDMARFKALLEQGGREQAAGAGRQPRGAATAPPES